MNKPLILFASAVVIALTACSKSVENLSEIDHKVSEPTQEELQIEEEIEEEKKAESIVAVKSVESPDYASKFEKTTNSKTAQPVAFTSNTRQSKEMVLFLKTLDKLGQQARDKQGEINEKLQTATSRKDDDAIIQITIDLLKKQRKQLEAMPLTDAKLIEIRDKLVKSNNIAIEANQEVISIRQPTPEDERALVAKFTKGRQLSEEAKADLMTLVKSTSQP